MSKKAESSSFLSWFDNDYVKWGLGAITAVAAGVGAYKFYTKKVNSDAAAVLVDEAVDQINDEKLDAAVDTLTKAIALSADPSFYLMRARAHLRNESFRNSWDDAQYVREHAATVYQRFQAEYVQASASYKSNNYSFALKDYRTLKNDIAAHLAAKPSDLNSGMKKLLEKMLTSCDEHIKHSEQQLEKIKKLKKYREEKKLKEMKEAEEKKRLAAFTPGFLRSVSTGGPSRGGMMFGGGDLEREIYDSMPDFAEENPDAFMEEFARIERDAQAAGPTIEEVPAAKPKKVGKARVGYMSSGAKKLGGKKKKAVATEEPTEEKKDETGAEEKKEESKENAAEEKNEESKDNVAEEKKEESKENATEEKKEESKESVSSDAASSAATTTDAAPSSTPVAPSESSEGNAAPASAESAAVVPAPAPAESSEGKDVAAAPASASNPAETPLEPATTKAAAASPDNTNLEASFVNVSASAETSDQ